MIRFFIELLVRRKWFGQFKLYFVLNWLVMRCKLGPNLRQTRSCPSQGNSSNYYVILGPRDKAAPPTSQKIKIFSPKRVSEVPSDTVVYFFFFFFFSSSSSSSTGELCSQPIRGNVRRIGRMFPEYAERSFLDPEYSFVAVRRLLRTIFAKQRFPQ